MRMGTLYRISNLRGLTRACQDFFEWIRGRNRLAFAITLFLLWTSFSAFGQSAGDYRSVANGNWSNPVIWQYHNGITWTNAGPYGYPGQNAAGAAVQIRHNVTINVSPARSIESLQIDGDMTLNSSGDPDLSVTGNVYLQSDWIWILINIPIPSTFSFGNGNLSIGGSLTLDPACAFTFGTGAFTSTGTIYLDNYLFFPSTFQNNGTATLSNTGAGILDGGGEWTQGTNSTLNYAGSSLNVGTLNASATGNLVNYYRNGTQGIYAPSGNTYHHLTLQGTGTKTSSGNLDINGDLTIAGSAQLNVDTGNDNINLAGDWNITSTNSDPFLQGTQRVTLDGTTAQTITPSTGGETFYGLTIDNSFGASPQVTVSGGNVTVSSVLRMDGGNVNLNGNSITLNSSGTGALNHSSGWMYGGNIARARPGSQSITVGSDHSLFPLGSFSDWRPFYVGQNSNSGTAGVMTVSHTNSTSTSDVNINDNGTIIRRRHNSFWSPTTTGTGGTYVLRAGGTNFGIILLASHLRMATSTGTGVTGNHSGGSGGALWFVNRTNVSRANLNGNNFHLASTDKDDSPLPIELLSFSAQLKNDFVELKWSTSIETNNDFFTIERSSNVEHFEPILQHDGAGTTKELTDYRVIDPSPLYGRSYYRLKQTDFDGKFTYSSVRVIDYKGPEHATLTIFPNPSTGKNLSIKIEGLRDAKQVPIQILNMRGQKVYEKMVFVKTPGVITEDISRQKVLPSGLYIIKAGNTLYLTQKIVIE